MECAPAALKDIDLSSLPKGVPPMPSDVPIPTILSEQSAGCCSRWRYWVSLTLCLGVCYKSMRNNAVKCFTCNQCCINAKGDVSGSMHDNPKEDSNSESSCEDSDTDEKKRKGRKAGKEKDKRTRIKTTDKLPKNVEQQQTSAFSGYSEEEDEEDSDSGEDKHKKKPVKRGKRKGKDKTKTVSEARESENDEAVVEARRNKRGHEKKPKGKKKTTESVSAESETDNDDRIAGMSESNKRQKVYDKHTDSNGEEDSDSDKEEYQKASVKQDKTQKRMTEDEKDKVKRSKGKSKSREGSDQAEETDLKSREGDATDKQTDQDKTAEGKEDKSEMTTEAGSLKRDNAGPSFFRNPSIRSTLLMEFLKEKVKSELETEAPKLCGSKGIGGLVENPQFLVYLSSLKILTDIAIQEVEKETTWGNKTKRLVGHLATCSSKQIFAFVWVLIEMNYGHHLKAITPEVTSLMREYTKDMVEKML